MEQLPRSQRRDMRTYHGISHHLPLPPRQVLSLTSLVEQRGVLAVKAAAQHYSILIKHRSRTAQVERSRAVARQPAAQH